MIFKKKILEMSQEYKDIAGSIKQRISVYLVNEAGKTVVEALDLFLFMGTVYVEVWVYVQVQGGQEALVDRQG